MSVFSGGAGGAVKPETANCVAENPFGRRRPRIEWMINAAAALTIIKPIIPPKIAFTSTGDGEEVGAASPATAFGAKVCVILALAVTVPVYTEDVVATAELLAAVVTVSTGLGDTVAGTEMLAEVVTVSVGVGVVVVTAVPVAELPADIVLVAVVMLEPAIVFVTGI